MQILGLSFFIYFCSRPSRNITLVFYKKSFGGPNFSIWVLWIWLFWVWLSGVKTFHYYIGNFFCQLSEFRPRRFCLEKTLSSQRLAICIVTNWGFCPTIKWAILSRLQNWHFCPTQNERFFKFHVGKKL